VLKQVTDLTGYIRDLRTRICQDTRVTDLGGSPAGSALVFGVAKECRIWVFGWAKWCRISGACVSGVVVPSRYEPAGLGDEDVSGAE
jgi:hypothetical protein